MKFNISKQIQFRLIELIIRILAFRAIQTNPFQFNKNGAGGTTQTKVKSLIHKELAIFLLVTIGRSHSNSHYLPPLNHNK